MSHSSAVRFFDRATPPHISTLILIAGVSALSMNIFLPSLPDIAGHFDADYRLIQLSVAVYLAVNAFLQLFIGPISDRYGRRRVVLTGMALFILATLGCIFAPTVEVFLAFRMMQATVVVGMVLSRAIVRDMHPPDEAASKISYVTMGMAIAPMVGPVLGGFLGEAFGWEATFWLLVALGVYILFTCWQDLGETALDTSTSFKEQFRQYPGLLASPRFWGYCLTAAFASGAFFAYLGGGPYVGSDVYGLNTGRLGVYLGAPTVGYFIGNWYSGRYSVRYGLNKMIRVVLWGDDCGWAWQRFGDAERKCGFVVSPPAPGRVRKRLGRRDHDRRWRSFVGVGRHYVGTWDRGLSFALDYVCHFDPIATVDPVCDQAHAGGWCRNLIHFEWAKAHPTGGGQPPRPRDISEPKKDNRG